MLSDETASGKYPIEAVSFMNRIVSYAEDNTPIKVSYLDNELHDQVTAIGTAVIGISNAVAARAIVAETKTGSTALQISVHRSNIPIVAVTSDDRVTQQMSIVCGVLAYTRPVDPEAAVKLTKWLKDQNIFHSGDTIVSVSGQYPGVQGTTDTIKVRVLE
jgi:pyruvate kinase